MIKENKQARVWVCILYPDNENENKAIKIISDLPGSICMYHKDIYDDENNIISKKHCHCILQYNDPKWLSTVLKDLNLFNDLDDEGYCIHEHLFKKLKDIKYKSVKEYCIYLTHINEPDKERYSIDEFFGTDYLSAMSYCHNANKSSYEIFIDLMEFMTDFMHNNPQTHIWRFDQFYDYAKDHGYGYEFYTYWSKMKDLIRSWTSYL